MADIDNRRDEKRRQQKNMGNIMAGLVLLAAGGVLLARQLGYPIPGWMFGWEMVLITIGLFFAAKSNFKDYGWFIAIGIGVFFLVDEAAPRIANFFWPALIIIIGLYMILRTGAKKEKKDSTVSSASYSPGDFHKEDLLDVTSVFGANKRVVISKNFKGGEVVSVFGGSEINLMQADINGQATLEIVAVFGGVKLILPPDWEIRSEQAAVFGGVEDKRPRVSVSEPAKVLVLDGTAIFGGIEIVSH